MLTHAPDGGFFESFKRLALTENMKVTAGTKLR
jgi:hypothetical protein